MDLGEERAMCPCRQARAAERRAEEGVLVESHDHHSISQSIPLGGLEELS